MSADADIGDVPHTAVGKDAAFTAYKITTGGRHGTHEIG